MQVRSRNDSGAVAELNVTPLIDVLLVLLIIFMVIAPVAPVGLPAAIPQPAQADPPTQPAQAIVLRIDEGLAITLNTQRVEFEALEGRLADIFRYRGERVVFVQAQQDVEFRHVARLIDMVKAAGATRVGLLNPRA